MVRRRAAGAGRRLHEPIAIVNFEFSCSGNELEQTAYTSRIDPHAPEQQHPAEPGGTIRGQHQHQRARPAAIRWRRELTRHSAAAQPRGRERSLGSPGSGGFYIEFF